MNIAVIDYQGGNVQSVLFALQRLGVHNAVLTSDADEIRRADRVLFPGEGEASSAMRALRAAGLDALLPTLRQPFLGICLGMQLLGRHSAEGPAGGTPLLGLLPFDVVRFAPVAANDKVPHMGWNSLHELRGPLFAGIRGEQSGPSAAELVAHAVNSESLSSGAAAADYVYFVHSFYAPVGDYTIAPAQYPAAMPFSAGVRYRNFYGLQFHVEKSGPVGERILRNFLTEGLLE